jgi:hypothetical protein
MSNSLLKAQSCTLSSTSTWYMSIAEHCNQIFGRRASIRMRIDRGVRGSLPSPWMHFTAWSRAYRWIAWGKDSRRLWLYTPREWFGWDHILGRKMELLRMAQTRNNLGKEMSITLGSTCRRLVHLCEAVVGGWRLGPTRRWPSDGRAGERVHDEDEAQRRLVLWLVGTIG